MHTILRHPPSAHLAPTSPAPTSLLTHISLMNALEPPLPTRLSLIASLPNRIHRSNPFPYAPFMVLHFGLTDDPRAVGYYAGFIVSAFMIGRLVSSLPLGVLSDVYGRRPVVVLGLLSCILFQIAFGARADAERGGGGGAARTLVLTRTLVLSPNTRSKPQHTFEAPTHVRSPNTRSKPQHTF